MLRQHEINLPEMQNEREGIDFNNENCTRVSNTGHYLLMVYSDGIETKEYETERIINHVSMAEVIWFFVGFN